MNGKFLIRGYAPADEAALTALWKRCFGDSEELIHGFFALLPELGAGVTAELDGKPVGMAFAICGMALSSGEKCGYIYAVAVDESCRGFGAGAAYNALVALVQKWFPDRRGLVTGITICSAGASGLIMTPLCNGCIKSLSFSGAMLVVAGLYLVLGCLCGSLVTAPPAGYMADYHPTHVAVSSRQYSAGEMMRTRQFYLITFAYMFALPAYFLINPMMKSLGVERGLSEAQAVAGVMAAALLNVAGRLLVPWISDRLGRKPMLVVLFVVNIAAIAGLIYARGALFLALVVCIAFAYGGYCAIYPVVTADYFGSKNAGLNYGIVMTGCGIVSVLCPFLTAVGNAFSFVTAAICSVLGIVLTLVLRKPE